MKCSTILLVSINILFLIISVLIITSGSTVQYSFGKYYYILTNHSGVSIFPTLWIATGCFLMVVSLYGAVVSICDSILLIKTYGVLLSLLLVLQVAAAITGLTLGFCRSKEIADDTLNAFMHSYEYDTSLRESMDWMQLKYKCCGNKGPNDWINFSILPPESNTTPPTSNPPPESNTTLPTSNLLPESNNTTTLSTSNAMPYTAALSTSNAMPSSCCIRGSDYINFRCIKHHSNGCYSPLQEIISANIMVASFLALGLALFELLGAVIAFTVSKTIRRERNIETDYSKLGIKKTYR